MFAANLHKKYFRRCLLESLPHFYTELDTQRVVVVYFCVVGLDVLGELDTLSTIEKSQIVDYLYSNQLCKNPTDIHSNDTIPDLTKNSPGQCTCGFLGSAYCGLSVDTNYCGDWNVIPVGQNACPSTSSLLEGHLAMTYAALATLITLGDTLERVQADDILASLPMLQCNETGAFRATQSGDEYDMRFVYCACAISSLLARYSSRASHHTGALPGIDEAAVVRYIQSCRTYEGGFSLVPGGESHGGSCYCAMASLVLMNRVEEVLDNGALSALLHWCISRQHHSQTNKDPQSLYGGFNGATIQLCGELGMSDEFSTLAFILRDCQHPRSTWPEECDEGFEGSVNTTCVGSGASVDHVPSYIVPPIATVGSGGFSKQPDSPPDVLHTFYSICWLSMRCRLDAVGAGVTEVNTNAAGERGALAMEGTEGAKKTSVSLPLTMSAIAGVAKLSTRELNVSLGLCTDRIREHP